MPTKPATPCRHCGSRRATRPRQLCWACFYDPAVRNLYPATSKYAHKLAEDHYGPAPLPAEPTAARPGTEAKIVELQRRASAMQQLFHPHDAH